MRILRILNTGVLLGAFVAVAAHAETAKLTANLQPSSEVPPTATKGSGKLDASFDTATHTLVWTVSYSGLTGPATAAHFHGPAPGRPERRRAGADRQGCAGEPDQGLGGAQRPAGHRADGGQVVLQRPYQGAPVRRDSRAGRARQLNTRRAGAAQAPFPRTADSLPKEVR